MRRQLAFWTHPRASRVPVALPENGSHCELFSSARQQAPSTGSACERLPHERHSVALAGAVRAQGTPSVTRRGTRESVKAGEARVLAVANEEDGPSLRPRRRRVHRVDRAHRPGGVCPSSGLVGITSRNAAAALLLRSCAAFSATARSLGDLPPAARRVSRSDPGSTPLRGAATETTEARHSWRLAAVASNGVRATPRGSGGLRGHIARKQLHGWPTPWRNPVAPLDRSRHAACCNTHPETRHPVVGAFPIVLVGKGPSMIRNVSLENFSLLCLVAAASLVVGASALAYSVPRAVVATSGPAPAVALQQ